MPTAYKSPKSVGDRTERIYDSDNVLHHKYALNAPFTLFAKEAKKKITEDTIIEWWEKDKPGQYTAINNVAGYPLGTELQFILDETDFIQVKDKLLLQNGVTGGAEQVVVTDKDDTAKTVNVAYRAATPITLNDNDIVIRVGTAYADDDTSGKGVFYKPSRRYNCIATNRTPWEMPSSGAFAKTKYSSGRDELVEMQREALWRHFTDNEKEVFLSKYYVRAKSGDVEEFRSFSGLKEMLDTVSNPNHFDAGGAALTEYDIDSHLYYLSEYGSGEKTVFCNKTVIAAFERIAKQKGILNTFEFPGMWKSEVKRDGTVGKATLPVIVIPSWSGLKLNLVHHKGFDSWGITKPGGVQTGLAVIVDFGTDKNSGKNLVTYYIGKGLDGVMDAKILPDRQQNDRYGKKWEMITEHGVKLVMLEAHGWWKNIGG